MNLRALRKQLGLTQAQLAACLETRQATISNQERGKVPLRRERLLAVMYMVEHPEIMTDESDLAPVDQDRPSRP